MLLSQVPSISNLHTIGRQTNNHHFILHQQQQQQQQQKIMAGGGTSGQSLEYTPTWAFATISCFHVKRRLAETTTTVEHFTVGVIRNLNFPVAGLYNGNLWTIPRRGLDEDDVDAGAVNSTDKCTAEGKVSLVSQEGIHQLHIFFFVLAVMQIVYSVLTMALGTLKMRRWKAWEKETQTTEYQVANDFPVPYCCAMDNSI
ncbi:hypothetical protein TEA_008599 [Camellia sinensis var. sinensis]|uniref:MLO-like protein n=1 Tax=Camellia sinensis var. sinensis TaxID=542762 RepID=A0A4S4F1J1_CAMSN|nr:hypothetical protein TEA_008599 [Camellia sinensis var. sinensis]